MPDDTLALEVGNIGGEGDAEKAQAESQAADIATLQAEIKATKDALTELTSDKAATDDALLSPEYLAFLEQKKGADSTGQADADTSVVDTSAESDLDLNVASGNELASHILGKAAKQSEATVAAVSKRLDSIGSRLDYSMAMLDLRLAIAQKDGRAESWGDNKYRKTWMVEAKANPTWDATRVFESLESASELAALRQAKADKGKEDEERKSGSERGSAGVTSAATLGRDVSDLEAADEGYKDSFGILENQE